MENRDPNQSPANDPFRDLPLEDFEEFSFEPIESEGTQLPQPGELFDLHSLDLSNELPATPTSHSDLQSSSIAGSADPFEFPGVSEQTSDPMHAAAAISTAEESHVELSDAELELQRARRKLLFMAAPSWLISLFVHVAIILVLAMITLDPIQTVISILEASAAQDANAIEEFDLQGPQLDVPQSLDEPLSIPTPSVTPVVSIPELQSPMMPVIDTNMQSLDMNSLTESIMPSSLLSSSALAQMSTALNSRSAAAKSEMLEKFGGNADSEKAVAMALKWIAAHQAQNGGWTFAHSAICRNQCNGSGEMVTAYNGATALALLPFLGAGQTHLEGQYKETVKKGLAFLINNMQVTNNPGLPYGSWHEPGGRMYSHGLAAITICEAYAMTRDPDLMQPAQLAVNYLVYAQDPRGGGWRYNPGEPGDTSVVGWCLMALKSGRMGNLAVPQSSFAGANRFLDFVSTNKGAFYGYDEPSARKRDALTAVGLLCRMYLGWQKDQPGLQEGIEYLNARGPSSTDIYYNYYATQVMRHHGGEPWEKWNAKMRGDLVKQQVQEGHAAGSWDPRGSHSETGGRLYMTSLSTMILEVYYRHMPLYSEKSSDDDFEI